jgi:hypothetical protein
MSENYWGTKVPVGESEAELRGLIERFGANKYGMLENWEEGTLTIMFQYKEYPIRLDLDIEKIVKVRLEEEPYNNYRRCTEDEYESKIRDQAKMVGMRVLVHKVKSDLLAIEYGIMKPEEVFLSHFVTKSGRTVGEEVIPNLLDKLTNPSRLLSAGRKR